MADGHCKPCNCTRRRIIRCIRAPLLILMLGAAAVHAADCFCLLDDQRTPYRDCVDIPARGHTPASVDCRLTVGQQRKPVDGGLAMKRIDQGKPGCNPCRVQQRDPGHLIRGNGDRPKPDPVDQHNAAAAGAIDD